MKPTTEGCEECSRRDGWVQLRPCMSCGHVGGERWMWYHVDKMMLE